MNTSKPTSEQSSRRNFTELTAIPQGCLSTLAPWNHPEDLVSYTTQQTLKKVVDVYILIPAFLLSVPLNVLNMIVFYQHGITERINLCLFFLSLADIIVIAVHFELKLDSMYATITNTPYKMVVTKYSVNSMVHSLACFVYVSGFMSTLIALERCLCIVSPLKAQSMLQTKTTKVVIAAGHAVIFVSHYFISTRWEVVCMFDPLTEHSVDAYYSSKFYLNNKEIIDTLEGIIFGIFLPGLFVAGVSASTVITVVKLRQMKEWRQKATSKGNASTGTVVKDVSLTRMLIGTNILFVACTTLPLVFHALLPLIQELSFSGKYYNTYYFFMTLQQLCAFINSSINFIVYYCFGSKFRGTVRHMFVRCVVTHKQNAGGFTGRTVTSVTKKHALDHPSQGNS